MIQDHPLTPPRPTHATVGQCLRDPVHRPPLNNSISPSPSSAYPPPPAQAPLYLYRVDTCQQTVAVLRGSLEALGHHARNGHIHPAPAILTSLRYNTRHQSSHPPKGDPHVGTTNGVRAALNQRSRTLVHGAERAGARAMLKAVGFSDDDLAKPLIGVANTWTEIGPCNYHLRKLALDVKRGIREAGGTPFEFNTVSISDGITMGTEGMKGSLISREVIADSIELVAMSNMLDGVVALSACDKTIPGTIMALIRLDLPSLMLYGGTIYPGNLNGRDIDLVNVFEALGQFQAGDISYDELMDVENVACPGPGACGGQFTANTMAMISEIIGICPMGMGDVPAEDPEKETVAYQAGEMMLEDPRARHPPLRPGDAALAGEFAGRLSRHRRQHQQHPALPRFRP